MKLEKLIADIKSESGIIAEYKIVFGTKVANLILKVIKVIS